MSSFEFAQVIYGLGADDYNPLFAGWGESNNHFVRILSTDQIENSSCDCIIALDYETPVINDNNSSKSYNYTNIITDGYLPETVYTYHTDSQGNTKRIATVKRAPNKKSVKATVIVNEKKRICQARAHMTIKTNTKNCLLENKTWFDEREDSFVQSQVQGDRRALPSNYQPAEDAKDLDPESEMEDEVFANLKMKVYQFIVPKK